MQGIPRIKSVKPLDNLCLLVNFEGDIVKKYDVKKLFKKFPFFKGLESKPLFNLVKVDCGGFGLSWNDNLDLSEYEVWENGFTDEK
ncbi:MAG: DUF2442 domain-containing protein [bacterium]|nr:DUF2442 domain-containing protein [bacterium]